jgi:predicted nucleic acid-binding protein
MTAASLKAVFDTNILTSGHFWNGPPYRGMLAVEAGLATLVLSEPIVTEFRQKLTSRYGAPGKF